MRRWNVSDLVDFSICGDEVGAGESKPSPRPLLELCRRAGGGITPRECLVVGDTRSDTEMGRRSGAGFVVGVLTGSGRGTVDSNWSRHRVATCWAFEIFASVSGSPEITSTVNPLEVHQVYSLQH